MNANMPLTPKNHNSSGNIKSATWKLDISLGVYSFGFEVGATFPRFQ